MEKKYRKQYFSCSEMSLRLFFALYLILFSPVLRFLFVCPEMLCPARLQFVLCGKEMNVLYFVHQFRFQKR